MINLITNTAAQTIYPSLDEGRQYYADTFTHYLFILIREENTATGLDLAQVATIVSENARYTELTVTTVGLDLPGRYQYIFYGQNSGSNIDPNNAAVVGIVERGLCILSDSTVYFTAASQAINDDYVAGE